MTKRISAENYELERNQLKKDFEIYSQVENSDILKEYLILKDKIKSDAFIQKKKEVESLQFKGSPTEKLLKEHAKLKKNRKLKRYLEVSGSAELSRFLNLLDEGIPLKFEKLQTYVKAGAFKADKAKFKAEKDKSTNWETTDAYKKQQEFIQLKSSDDIRFYIKFKKSRAYKNYLNIKESSILKQLRDIEKEVTSDKFKERKAFLADKNRYEKTDDFKALKRFEELNNKNEIQVYNKYHTNDQFGFFRNYKLNYEENFDTIDTATWSSITPIAEKGLGKNVATANQLSYFLKENAKANSSTCQIISKKEQVKGIAWNPPLGFIEKEFEFASALIHNLKAFKQEYGYFEAKLKSPKADGVTSSISLINESELSCIRIATIENGLAKGGVINMVDQKRTFTGISIAELSHNFEIIGLSWTPEKLEWSLNGEVVGHIERSIPHEELGLRIESEVTDINAKLPHTFEIEWIKCYQKN